jgi:hypothetical protein
MMAIGVVKEAIRRLGSQVGSGVRCRDEISHGPMGILHE